MSKTIAENKANTQLYIQTQNAKKQVVKYTNNYAQHMWKQHAKWKNNNEKKTATTMLPFCNNQE